jgi:hypothetical protein
MKRMLWKDLQSKTDATQDSERTRRQQKFGCSIGIINIVGLSPITFMLSAPAFLRVLAFKLATCTLAKMTRRQGK